MRFLVPLMLAFSITSANAGPSFGEHARIRLDATANGETSIACVDETPPDHGKNPSVAFHVEAGHPIKINWMLTKVYNAFPEPLSLNV